jgi:hypothetical protein
MASHATAALSDAIAASFRTESAPFAPSIEAVFVLRQELERALAVDPFSPFVIAALSH